jgi:hypothetical protein
LLAWLCALTGDFDQETIMRPKLTKQEEDWLINEYFRMSTTERILYRRRFIHIVGLKRNGKVEFAQVLDFGRPLVWIALPLAVVFSPVIVIFRVLKRMVNQWQKRRQGWVPVSKLTPIAMDKEKSND